MKLFLTMVFVVLCVFVMRAHASATTCTIPNSFTNGTTADATQVNANFSALQTCGNNVDFRNIGASGIYASQIIPTSSVQATFGGSQTYIFPVGATVNGALTLNQTTANTIVSNSTGAVDAFVLNANNASQPTGKLLNAQANGVSQFSVDMSGNTTQGGLPTFSGLTTGTLCVHSVTKALASMSGDCLVNGTTVTVAQGGTNLTSLVGSKCIRSASGTAYAEAATDCPVLNANNNWAATQTATNYNVGAGGQYLYNNVAIIAPSATNTKIFPSSSGGNVYFESFAGVDNAHFVDAGGLTLDRGGVTATGASSSFAGVAAGGAITGATTINASGVITGVGITAGTGTSQGSSNGSAISYHPPAYTASGAAVGSTTHVVPTTCNVANTATTCTVTLTGAGQAVGAATRLLATVNTSPINSCGTASVQNVKIATQTLTVTLTVAAGTNGCPVDILVFDI